MSILIKITLLTTNRAHLPKYGLVKKNTYNCILFTNFHKIIFELNSLQNLSLGLLWSSYRRPLSQFCGYLPLHFSPRGKNSN